MSVVDGQITTPPPEPPSGPRQVWTQETRDRWFFGALAASTVSVLYLFSPFMMVLLFASVVVVVSWPLYERVLLMCRGRRALAAALTTLALAFVIFGPLGFLVYLFVQQAVTVVGFAIEYVQSGRLQGWIAYVATLPEHSEMLPAWAARFIPEDFDLQESIAGPLQDGALASLNAAGKAVPGLLNTTVNASIDAVIFVFAVLSMYMEGPRILRVIKNLSPMEDSYEERLFAVFGEFATNTVVGALATAAAMSVVAGVGYAIAGVDRVLFYAVLTGVFSFVPVIGTALVWVPLAILTGATQGVAWGAFLAAWSLLLTAQVDTFVRPMFMRGRTNIHPLLIFLAVFGGIGWMGVPGALVGPVLVAFFLALYTIYVEDYLGQATSQPLVQDHGLVPRWVVRLWERLIGARAAAPPPDTTTGETHVDAGAVVPPAPENTNPPGSETPADR